VSQVNLSKLFEMIEEIIDARAVIQEREVVQTAKKKTPKGVAYPTLALNKRWGIPDTGDRQLVNQVVMNLEGKTIQERIQNLNQFLEGCKEDCINEKNISKAISNIIILEALSSLVFDFNASPAGDLFEAFLAAMTGRPDIEQTGEQGGLADVGKKLSAKLIKNKTPVDGSESNLDAAVEAGGMDFLVAGKVQESNNGPLEVVFYNFNVPRDISRQKMSYRGGKFFINYSLYKDHQFATINIGTREELREIAQQYLDTLDDKISIIYESLGALTSQLNDYFIKNDTSSATAAKGTAEALSTNIQKLA